MPTVDHHGSAFCAQDCSPASSTSLPPTSAYNSTATIYKPRMPGPGTGRALSQSASSATIDFLRLPSKVRDEIYKRVLVVSHPLYLFQDFGSRVEIFPPRKPYQWLALLYASRQVGSEASAILYRMNDFVLLDETWYSVNLLRAFLNCIGPVNARSLSHLSINFPVVEGLPGALNPRADNSERTRLLQERCTKLLTLEMQIGSKISTGLTRTDRETPQFSREALSQLDAQLKAIPSLEKIIVRVHGSIPIPPVVESMQALGWVVLPANRDQW